MVTGRKRQARGLAIVGAEDDFSRRIDVMLQLMGAYRSRAEKESEVEGPEVGPLRKKGGWVLLGVSDLVLPYTYNWFFSPVKRSHVT
ncbi:hypothetical protein PanWU01x14_180730 [Parasponia andersonii]|uniref:Uncharacterized protein n=1 Tax=Parasponia andersonii TaxID=3476 RepID=A0A2P5C667_PARAD|nr:hypothetical protein PanWU01x14_180730 [Parasponia andersonii]